MLTIMVIRNQYFTCADAALLQERSEMLIHLTLCSGGIFPAHVSRNVLYDMHRNVLYDMHLCVDGHPFFSFTHFTFSFANVCAVFLLGNDRNHPQVSYLSRLEVSEQQQIVVHRAIVDVMLENLHFSGADMVTIQKVCKVDCCSRLTVRQVVVLLVTFDVEATAHCVLLPLLLC